MGTAPGTSQFRGVQLARRIAAVYSTELVWLRKFLHPRNNNKRVIKRVLCPKLEYTFSKCFLCDFVSH
jgi:hypothetical protein